MLVLWDVPCWREKNTKKAEVLNSEEDDSFRKALDVAWASDKTYEGVKKQWNIQ